MFAVAMADPFVVGFHHMFNVQCKRQRKGNVVKDPQSIVHRSMDRVVFASARTGEDGNRVGSKHGNNTDEDTIVALWCVALVDHQFFKWQ